MARAMVKVLLTGVVLLTLVGAAVAAPARQGALLAAIVFFRADALSVDYAEVEAGAAQVSLSWQTVNTNGQYRLALEQYQQDNWVSVIGETEVLPLNGSRQVTVGLPQNFGVPTYRLTLKTSQNEIIEQQFLTLPYDAAAQSSAVLDPSIVVFTTPVQSIDTNLLVQSNTRLMVQWQVADRHPDTLIRFEQVMPDGSTISAEPRRTVLWMPSQGEAGIVPRTTASKADLLFRMSLVNASDGTVYDSAEFSLPVIGNVVIAPPQIASGNGSGDTTAAGAQGSISAFSAQSGTVPAGGSVTLNWDAGDAASVNLLQTVPEGGPTTLYIELPPSGSMTVPLPPESSGAVYTLRAQSATGEVMTGEVTVTTENP